MDSEATVTPHPRRRWKRWAIAFLALFFGAAWLFTSDGETLRKARLLQLGQTYAEVRAIMGKPYQQGMPFGGGHFEEIYASLSERRGVEARTGVRIWLRDLGITTRFPNTDAPVEVGFYRGRVEYIRRGNDKVHRWIEADETADDLQLMPSPN